MSPKVKALLAAAGFAALMAPAVADACTGIMLRNSDGSVVHGRTVEFGITLDMDYAVVPRNYQFVGQTPLGPGKSWASKYAAAGVITFGNLAIMDGLNEKGLALGAFYFPTFAEYTETTSENQAKSLSAADFSNWILTSFATVDEVRQAIESGEVYVAPTLLPGWPQTPQPFHWIVYDKTGKSLVIEPLKGKLVLYDNPLGVLTNSPDFDWHLTNLRNYIALDPKGVPPVDLDGIDLTAFGMGAGMLGIPGDFTPPARFVRATVYSSTIKPAADSKAGVFSGFHILNNFDIPWGVARETANGKTEADHTLLTTMRDPDSLRIYYKTFDDQTLRMIDLASFDFDAKDVKRLSTAGQQPVVNMTDKFETATFPTGKPANAD